MQKEKLAIVSSYTDFCGNASYTRALAEGLAKHFDITVISLKVNLLRNGDSKAAKLHVKRICEQLRNFDCVNIQFEAGLFGANPRSIRKRFFAIANASKRLVLTMHRYHKKEKYPGLISLGKKLMKGRFKSFLHAIKAVAATNLLLPVYDSVIRYCKKNNYPILLHTERDRELIHTKFNYNGTFDHPLSFYDQQYYEKIRDDYSREDFCKHHALNEYNTFIGIFGFISENKGHETAIRAMKFLPEHYELLIFGSQHPHSIQLDVPIDEYIGDLMELIIELGLTCRVKFIRSLNDDEFLKAMIRCDFNILPYLEVNQGGSGIAALSLESLSKTIFSQNKAFFELEKYAPNSFKMFTIGNYLELAHAIQSYRKDDYEKSLIQYNKRYNIHTNAELYAKLVKMSGSKCINEHLI